VKKKPVTSFPEQLRDWWSRNQTALLRTAIAILASYTVMKLGSEFYRLLFDESRLGALDLSHRYLEVNLWFSHERVYLESVYATYPPMSYLFFWLALGWAPFGFCRWLWAGLSLLSLVWLSRIVVLESGAETRLERIFAALLPFSMAATGVAVGNGQLVPILIPMLCTAVLLTTGKRKLDWRSESAIVLLMLTSLVHPPTAAPFFLIVLIVAPRLRPALLVALGYLLLTILASSFQAEELPALANSWVINLTAGKEPSGYADVHYGLWLLGLGKWIYPASGLMITGLAIWIFTHRRADPWLLLGVTAIVARLWTYHGVYDDMLLIIPMVTLFRIAGREAERNEDIVATVLLGANVAVAMLPVRMHFFWEPPWPAVFGWAHVAVWVPTLLFLLIIASRAPVRHIGNKDLASGGAAVNLAFPRD